MFLLHLFSPWTWKMAARDSRRSRRRLLLFSVSIMLGIAALVAIGSLKENLVQAVEDQAKALVGSDAFLNGRKAFTKELDELLNSSGALVARETSGIAMLQFPQGKPEGNLFRVEARGVDPAFPFYGTPVTDPPDAWQKAMAGQGMVMDSTLLEQAGAKVGDTVKLGGLETVIAGVFVVPPARAGWAGAFGVISPEVFYARSLVQKAGLAGGFFTFHRAHMKFPGGQDPEAWAEKNRPAIKKQGGDLETVERRRKNIGKVLDSLYSFLSLLGFIALVLGGLGVASAIHVHAQQRLPTVATLRCLGCTASQAFAIFLVQGVCLGMFGAVGGVLIGLGLQKALPWIFKSYMPIEVDLTFQPWSILIALGLGFLICVSFAMLPLLKIRRVSPLAAVRAAYSEPVRKKSIWVWALWIAWVAALAVWHFGQWRKWGLFFDTHTQNLGYILLFLLGAGLLLRAVDPFWWLILGVLAGTLTWLAFSLSPPKAPEVGYLFAVALGTGLLVLALIAKLVVWLARLVVRPFWPYTFRQGLLNLHRPRNQTMLFLLSAGLGVCLILTMILVQDLLLGFIESKALKDKPNLIVLDVKHDQRAAISGLITSHGAAAPDFAPMVSMKLTHVKGVALPDLQKNDQTRLDNWILGHDFRSTYRATLTKSEKLIAGELPKTYSGEGPVPVTIEKGLAGEKGKPGRLQVGVGDNITFQIAGNPVECRIVGLREIEWQEVGLNFFFVFPEGVLEKLPHTGVLTARLGSPAASAAAQREILKLAPNVNLFDIGEIFATLTSIVDKVAFVIRFMALFTVLTGAVILSAVIVSGKRDRVEESVLLRTLGASRSQIWRILVSEYALLGLIAAISGGVLALFAAQALATRVFHLEYHAWVGPCAIAVAVVCAFTTAVGLALSRGVATEPPLSILRGD